MRAAWILAPLLLAGCLGGPPGSATVLLDGASAKEIAPSAAQLPPGFTLGWEQAHEGGADGVAESVSRVFDYRNNASVRHGVSVQVQRFDSMEGADAVFSFMTQGPSHPQRVEDGLYWQKMTRGDPSLPEGYGESDVAFGRKGLHVVTASVHAQGEPARADALALVRDMLARVPSAS